MRWTAALLAGALIVAASSANAQTPTAAPGTPSNPITLERVPSRFVLGPDYRLTAIDGETGQLAGVSGGWLQEELWYIGGAFYSLVSGASAWDMHYGGLVLGLQMPVGRRISFGGRSLIGMGDATTDATYSYGPTRDIRFGRHPGFREPSPAVPGSFRAEMSGMFFVFEPEATVSWRITERIRFGASAGYRFTGDEFFDDRLNGASGALTVQFGLGGS